MSKVNLFRWKGFCTSPDNFDRVLLHAWALLMRYGVQLPSGRVVCKLARWLGTDCVFSSVCEKSTFTSQGYIWRS